MRKLRVFIRMKYEQFLMRRFDRLLTIMAKSRVNWYPSHVVANEYDQKIQKLQEKISDLEYRLHREESEADVLEYQLLRRDERIEELENALSFYEPDEDN